MFEKLTVVVILKKLWELIKEEDLTFFLLDMTVTTGFVVGIFLIIYVPLIIISNPTRRKKKK